MSSAVFQYERAPGRIIRGNMHPVRSGKPEAAVLIIHGFKGFKDWGMFPYAAEKLAETFDVVRINLSHNGVGESLTDFDELDKFGRQTFSGDLEDIKDVAARMRQGTLPLTGQGQSSRQPQAEKLILLGHSRGGGESIVFALDEPAAVQGVVSWNGAVRFEGIFGEAALRAMREEGIAYSVNARTKQKMPLERVILDDLEANRQRFDIIERIGGLKVPLTLIQGTEDHPGLLKGSEALVAGNPSVRWIRIPGGDHTFGAKHPYQGTTEPLEAALSATVQAVREMLV